MSKNTVFSYMILTRDGETHNFESEHIVDAVAKFMAVSGILGYEEADVVSVTNNGVMAEEDDD